MAFIEWLLQVLSTPIGQTLVQGLVHVAIVIIGGQYLLSRYAMQRKRREQELELARFVKEHQYEALEQLYRLFATFMQLFREINSVDIDLADRATRHALFLRCAEAEAAIDAAILRIGSEFPAPPGTDLAMLLGNLRQSVQLWRESVREGQRLPFSSSEQPDYVRFKAHFARTTAYLASAIYEKMDAPRVQMDEAASLLMGAFSNRIERRAGGRPME